MSSYQLAVSRMLVEEDLVVSGKAKLIRTTGDSQRYVVFTLKNPNLTMLQGKSQLFAVKEFREHPSIDKDFQRERGVLERLRRFPHPHVVVHLTSWLQENKYYIVFPLARCNLREYMEKDTTPALTKTFVLWIMRQFHGLADGLRMIHNLRDSSTIQSISLAAPTQRGCEQGYHHDLKPENILLFGTPGSEDAKLKISDFGLGKIHVLRSGGRDKSHWTQPTKSFPTYSAPDGELLGSISRPADMWSLGCVFLELLVWIFIETEPAEEAFPNARNGFTRPDTLPPPNPDFTDDAFWSIDGNGIPFLREGVVDYINRVRCLCSGKRAFERVLERTEKLLDPVASTRLTAVLLANDLDAYVRQTKDDLDQDENLYLNQDPEFPAETMLPLLHTLPPSPESEHAITGESPSQIPLSESEINFGGIVASPPLSPMEESGLNRARRTSYGASKNLPVPRLGQGRSRGLSTSSAISDTAATSGGSPHGSIDDYHNDRDCQDRNGRQRGK
jgi:serine/threonine protein kinase